MKYLNGILLAAILLADGGLAEEVTIPAPDKSAVKLQAEILNRPRKDMINAGGKVIFEHYNTRITCLGSSEVYMLDGQFAIFRATGTIEAIVGEKKICGGALVYDEQSHLLSMSDNPTAQEGNTTYRADKRILCYTDTGVMRFEPSAQIIIKKSSNKPPERRKKFLGIF